MEPRFAPYAPPSAVLKVVRHYRDRDVPERITLMNLIQLGVTEPLAPRTMAALKFLGLVQEDGATTEQFKAIRYASEDDYQRVFGGVLDAAYKDIFDHVEIATASEAQIDSAFRPYSPGGQRGRMITLFLALCQEAGMSVAVSPRVGSPRARVEGRKATSPIPKKRTTAPPPVRLTEKRVIGETTESHPSTVFTVSIDDLPFLGEDFDDVWAALGKVALARAKARATERAKAANPRPESEGNEA